MPTAPLPRITQPQQRIIRPRPAAAQSQSFDWTRPRATRVVRRVLLVTAILTAALAATFVWSAARAFDVSTTTLDQRPQILGCQITVDRATGVTVERGCVP